MGEQSENRIVGEHFLLLGLGLAGLGVGMLISSEYMADILVIPAGAFVLVGGVFVSFYGIRKLMASEST